MKKNTLMIAIAISLFCFSTTSCQKSIIGKDTVVETIRIVTVKDSLPLGWFAFAVTPDYSWDHLLNSPFVRILDSSMKHSIASYAGTKDTTRRDIFFGPLPPTQQEYSPKEVVAYLQTLHLVPASWEDLNGFEGEYHDRLKWQAYNFSFVVENLKTTIPINGDTTIGVVRLLTQTGPTSPLYLSGGNSKGPTFFFYNIAGKRKK